MTGIDIIDSAFTSALAYLAGFPLFTLIIAVTLLVVILVGAYVIDAFKWQFIGRKSGLQKDWMPFVPFANTVYKLSIVEEQWWKMFFLDGWVLYSYLIFTLIRAISNGEWTSLAAILVVVYILCYLAYNVYWRYKFYQAHAIKPHLSMAILVPGLGMVCTMWDYLIAFGRNYPFTGEGTSRAVMDMVNVPQMRDAQGNAIPVTRAVTPADYGAPWKANQQGKAAQPAVSPAPGGSAGSISGMSGMYAGQTMPLATGEELIIGRDSAYCNLIVDQNADKVSRKHCGVLYDTAMGAYKVTDYSSNGTFIDGGSRLVANMPTTLQAGTIIVLGSRENRFRLN